MNFLKVFFVVLMLSATPSYSQQNQCAEFEVVIQSLNGNYGETLQSSALINDGSMIQMWANLETGSWTAISVKSSGLACVLSAGTHYKNEPQGIDV